MLFLQRHYRLQNIPGRRLGQQQLPFFIHSEIVPQLLNYFALKKQVCPILIKTMTHYTSSIEFHTSPIQVHPQWVAIIAKSPQEVLYFIWTLRIPNLIPQ
jgi:hypothetical protein